MGAVCLRSAIGGVLFLYFRSFRQRCLEYGGSPGSGLKFGGSCLLTFGDRGGQGRADCLRSARGVYSFCVITTIGPQ